MSLEIRGLCVDLPVGGASAHPVRDVDLDLTDGETICLVGESGSGKSMTALSVIGLLPPNARRRALRLRLDGLDLTSMPPQAMKRLRGRDITMIFQDPTAALDPSRTIGYQLEEVYLRHRKGSRRAASRRASELLERVGISAPDDRLKQYPHQLSGGLRQRVMIAMALICDPKLLIADEPTTALDATTQIEILRLLRELKEERRLSVLFITHDFGVVAHIADRVAVMYAGQIVETGTVADIIGDPRHPYTRALLRCLPEAAVGGGRINAIAGSAPSTLDLPQGCAFCERCENVMDPCRSSDGISLRSLDRGREVRCLLCEGRNPS
ncbi:MAG: ABC transporter ATP-binding protein [Hyphomicrobiales bacterium]